MDRSNKRQAWVPAHFPDQCPVNRECFMAGSIDNHLHGVTPEPQGRKVGRFTVIDGGAK
jgi:hypothetical protein